MSTAASVAEQLHALWAADSTLHAALPATRAFTGRVPHSTTMPYASLTQPMGSRAGQGTINRRADEQWQIQVWSEDYATGEAIQRAIAAAFDNADAELANGNILKISVESQFVVEEEEPDSSVWQITTMLSVLVERAR